MIQMKRRFIEGVGHLLLAFPSIDDLGFQGRMVHAFHDDHRMNIGIAEATAVIVAMSVRTKPLGLVGLQADTVQCGLIVFVERIDGIWSSPVLATECDKGIWMIAIHVGTIFLVIPP